MDKQEVVRTCFYSFYGYFNCPTIFIIDKPEKWITNLVRTYPSVKDIITIKTSDWQSGNETTFYKQLDIAKDLDEPVLFLEDDYYWVNRSAQTILEEGIQRLGLVSPYDHPRHYIEPEHNIKREVKALDHHWQSIISTCLTFGAMPELINKHIDTFKGHGTVDHEMWKEITQKDKLWSPIPSLAVHCETEFISPTFTWKKIL